MKNKNKKNETRLEKVKDELFRKTNGYFLNY